MIVPLTHVLILAAILFALGLVCVMVWQSNVIMLLIGIEIMLNAAMLVFVAGSLQWQAADGQVFALMIMAMTSAEVSLALALVVGLPLWGAGNSFLMRVVTALKAGKAVSTAAEEVRTPIDVITLGRALLELAGGRQGGVFHLAGLTRVNRLQMNQTIAARFGFPLHLLAAQPPAERSGRAPRPRDVSLQCAKAGAQLKTPLRTFDEGLSLILERGDTSAA